MDLIGWLGWGVATVSTALAIWQFLKDRYRLVVNVRYMSAIGAYTIEVRNIGRRPITITGAGLTGIPSIPKSSQVYVWGVDKGLPHRLEEGDCVYLNVPWGGAVSDRDQAERAWVRDANGKVHFVPLELPGKDPVALQGVPATPDAMVALTDEQLTTRLYNLELQREYILESQRQLDHIYAQLDYYEQVVLARQMAAMAQPSIKIGKDLSDGDGSGNA